MERPKFEDIKTYSEFEKYYWYREELQTICKNLGLEYLGNKQQLNEIIRAYFQGEKVVHKPIKHQKTKVENLTLNTSLIDCGFNFGPKFRNFFIEVTGDKNFKFNADMVASAKKVKEVQDKAFTLGQLLDIKLGKITYAKYDNSSCEWNKFLKDFCADKQNDNYENKLKIASEFWKLLRESDLQKVYTREFIENNKDKV